VQASIDPRAQQNRIERFWQIILGPGLDAADDALGLRQGRDHDHRNAAQPLIRLHTHQHVKAVDIGHHQIEQDEVELIVGERLQRLLAAGHRSDAMPIAGQPARQEIAVGLDIIYDENGAGFGDSIRPDWPETAHQVAHHGCAGLIGVQARLLDIDRESHDAIETQQQVGGRHQQAIEVCP